MILNTTNSESQYIGDIKENVVGIDKENINFITTLLTSSLYSKPLQSFFRETVSNAYDSCVEAGKDNYIIIYIETKNKDNKTYNIYNYYYDSTYCTISIRDYGTGLSPERFNTIYTNIGSSTKRESNDYIGMFGK